MLLQEVRGQKRDVLRARPQRRDLDREHGEAVEQIVQEGAFTQRRLQIAVRGRNHPDVDRDGGRAPDAPDLAFLEHPQQLGLQRGGHVADLVEEQRAPPGPARNTLSAAPSPP